MAATVTMVVVAEECVVVDNVLVLVSGGASCDGGVGSRD